MTTNSSKSEKFRKYREHLDQQIILLGDKYNLPKLSGAESAAWIYAHHWTYDSISMRKEFSSTGVSLMRFSDIVVRTNLTHDISKNPYLEYRYFQTREKMHYEFKKIREGQTL